MKSSKQNTLFYVTYSYDPKPLFLQIIIRKFLRPATGHLDTGFSRFPCVYKQILTDGSQHSKLPLHASRIALRT